MNTTVRAIPASINVTGLWADEAGMASTFRAERQRIVPVSTVVAARNGDADALGTLGSASFRRLIAFYRYSGLSPDEAEELAADTVADVVGSLYRLRDEESYDGWMWAIGRNKLRGWLRRRMRRELIEPLTPVGSGPEDALVESEEHEGIRAALASLSSRDRELLWLREVEGLSYTEIGGRLGAASGTVRVACHRARKRLEKAFRGNDDQGDLRG